MFGVGVCVIIFLYAYLWIFNILSFIFKFIHQGTSIVVGSLDSTLVCSS